LINERKDIQYIIGDSRSVLSKIADQTIHLVITSPPYWNAKDYGIEGQIGYDQSYTTYLDNLMVVWRECERLLVPNGKICVNIQPIPVSKEHTELDRSSIKNIMKDVENQMESIGLALSNMFIWDKRKYNNQRIFGSYPYPPNLYSHISFEYIYVFRKRGESRKVSETVKEASKLSMDEWKDWCFNSIWDIPPVIKYTNGKEDPASHIAPYPVEIPKRLIRLFSFVGDTVLDPFLGCGTTLAACVLEKRNGIGVELQPKYEPLINQMINNPKHMPTFEMAELLEKNKTLLDF